MRHRSTAAVLPLPPELSECLRVLRGRRGFAAEKVLAQKSALLNAYFKTHHLQGAVLGLSGGIDSALVLSLLLHASKAPQSPITTILPICLPCSNNPGVSGQKQAVLRARVICQHVGVPLIERHRHHSANCVPISWICWVHPAQLDLDQPKCTCAHKALIFD